MKRLRIQDENDRRIKQQFKDMRLELLIIVKKYLTSRYPMIEAVDWAQIKTRSKKILATQQYNSLKLEEEEKEQKIRPGSLLEYSDNLERSFKQI